MSPLAAFSELQTHRSRDPNTFSRQWGPESVPVPKLPIKRFSSLHGPINHTGTGQLNLLSFHPLAKTQQLALSKPVRLSIQEDKLLAGNLANYQVCKQAVRGWQPKDEMRNPS